MPRHRPEDVLLYLRRDGVRQHNQEMCPEILPGFDRDIAKRLRTLLGRRGVKFAVNASVTAIEEGYTVRSTWEQCRPVASRRCCRPVLCLV